MSIVELHGQDFTIIGSRTKALAIRYQEPMLLLFYGTGCPGCHDFDPIFRQIAAEERRITYGRVNVMNYKEVPAMSRETSAPIQSIPTLILYSNGTPIAKYNGKKNKVSIMSFITKGLIEIQKSRPSQQSQGGRPHHPPVTKVGNGKSWMPDIGSKSQEMAMIKGTTKRYAIMGGDEEDEMKLLRPEGITPHNAPWEKYKRMDMEYDQ